MLNVMIVDDEPLVRIALKSIIDWERHGFIVHGEAENGKQCLNLLQQDHYDVIFTDIRMPLIDGLQLIKTVKQEYPDILIVALSAYDEFDLVKKALTSGAEDYILKSELSFECAESTLLMLKERHAKLSQEKARTLHMEKSISESNTVLRMNFFRDLLSYDTPLKEEQILSRLEQYGLPLSNRQLVITVLTINNKGQETGLVETVTKNFANEMFKNEENFLCLTGGKNEVVLIHSYQNHVSELSALQAIRNDTERLCGNIKKFLNIDVTAAVSNRFNGFSNLFEVYNDTKEILHMSFFDGPGNIYYKQDFQARSLLPDSSKVDELTAQFRAGVDRMDFVFAAEALNSITREFMDKSSSQNYEILRFYCTLLTAIINKSVELSLFYEVFPDERNPYEYLLSCSTIQAVEGYLLTLLALLDKQTGGQSSNPRYGDAVNKLIQYINQNSHAQISLVKAAEELSYNPNYLSTKFKEETGVSFSEYLNNVRIQNAKRFLSSGKYKPGDVAEHVGYSDQRYFVKIFKRVVGMTPREYMRSLH